MSCLLSLPFALYKKVYLYLMLSTSVISQDSIGEIHYCSRPSSSLIEQVIFFRFWTNNKRHYGKPDIQSMDTRQWIGFSDFSSVLALMHFPYILCVDCTCNCTIQTSGQADGYNHTVVAREKSIQSWRKQANIAARWEKSDPRWKHLWQAGTSKTTRCFNRPDLTSDGSYLDWNPQKILRELWASVARMASNVDGHLDETRKIRACFYYKYTNLSGRATSLEFILYAGSAPSTPHIMFWMISILQNKLPWIRLWRWTQIGLFAALPWRLGSQLLQPLIQHTHKGLCQMQMSDCVAASYGAWLIIVTFWFLPQLRAIYYTYVFSNLPNSDVQRCRSGKRRYTGHEVIKLLLSIDTVRLAEGVVRGKLKFWTDTRGYKPTAMKYPSLPFWVSWVRTLHYQ